MFTIYPAIDLRGGKVVRLKEGDPARMTSYSDDPAETAKRWIDAGAAWLHVVNLDGAFGDNAGVGFLICPHFRTAVAGKGHPRLCNQSGIAKPISGCFSKPL